MDESRLKSLQQKWLAKKNLVEPGNSPFEAGPSTPQVKGGSNRLIPSEASGFSKFLKKENKSRQVLRVLKKRVNLEDVSLVGEELALRFQHDRVSLQQAFDRLVSQADSEDQVSIRQLKDALQSAPFSISKSDQAELVARYLVEDNLEEKLPFDDRLTVSSVVLKSVLRKFLQFYELTPKEEELRLTLRLNKLLTDNYQKLIAEFAIMKSKLGDFCPKEKLVSLFRSQDLFLELEEVNLILVRLFGISKDVQRLPFYEVFALFQVDWPGSRK